MGAMLHDLYPDPMRGTRVAWNADAVVPNGKPGSLAGATKGNEDAGGIPVLDGVIYSFLSNPKEVGCDNLAFDDYRLTASKRAVDLEESGGCFCILQKRLGKALTAKFDRVKSVRKVARFFDSLVKQVADFLGLGCFGSPGFRKSARKQVPHDCRAGEVLAKTVVEFLSDQLFFAFADA